jgi:hypothetical protein
VQNKFSILIAVSFLQVFSIALFGKDKTAVSNYRLYVRIEPTTGMLNCKTEIENPSDSIFVLNNDLEIRRVVADGRPVPYHLNSTNSSPNSVEISLESSIRKNIVFEYAGRIKPESFPRIISVVNMIDSNLVELATYVSWFPRSKSGTPFDFRMNVDLPSNFIAVANGALRTEKREGDRRISEWESFAPGWDIALVAAPHLKKSHVARDGVTVEIYHERLPDSYIDSMKTNLLRSMTWLTDMLGSNRSDKLIRVVYSPRPAWGYVRTPLIIVSEEAALSWRSQKFGPARDFRYLTHEISHYWWSIADVNTPDDWINEGLAEYSTFLVSEDLVGNDFTNQLLVEYKERAANSSTETAIAETENNSPDREVNRYAKPVLIFNDARRMFGTEKLYGFFRALYKRFALTKAANTEAFLDEAGKDMGSDAKQFFANALHDKKWGAAKTREKSQYSYAESDSTFMGTWSGILVQTGGKLRIIIHLIQSGTGITPTLDCPDMNAKGIPLSDVRIVGDSLWFKLDPASASFAGRLDQGTSTISGEWAQYGSKVTFELKREVAIEEKTK